MESLLGKRTDDWNRIFEGFRLTDEEGRQIQLEAERDFDLFQNFRIVDVALNSEIDTHSGLANRVQSKPLVKFVDVAFSGVGKVLVNVLYEFVSDRADLRGYLRVWKTDRIIELSTAYFLQHSCVSANKDTAPASS